MWHLFPFVKVKINTSWIKINVMKIEMATFSVCMKEVIPTAERCLWIFHILFQMCQFVCYYVCYNTTHNFTQLPSIFSRAVLCCLTWIVWELKSRTDDVRMMCRRRADDVQMTCGQHESEILLEIWLADDICCPEHHPQACMSSARHLQVCTSSAHCLQHSSWSAWTWTIFLLWQELVIGWNLSQQCWVVSFQDHVNDLRHNLCWWFSLHVASGHCSHVIWVCTCHPHIIWAYAYYAHIFAVVLDIFLPNRQCQCHPYVISSTLYISYYVQLSFCTLSAQPHIVYGIHMYTPFACHF